MSVLLAAVYALGMAACVGVVGFCAWDVHRLARQARRDNWRIPAATKPIPKGKR